MNNCAADILSPPPLSAGARWALVHYKQVCVLVVHRYMDAIQKNCHLPTPMCRYLARRVEAVVTSLRWWMTWWWPGVSSSQLLAGCRDCTVEGIEQTSDRFCTTERKNEQMELHVTISFSFLKWVKERIEDEVGKQMVSLAFFQSTDQIWFYFFLKFEVCPSFLKSVSKHTKINTNKNTKIHVQHDTHTH